MPISLREQLRGASGFKLPHASLEASNLRVLDIQSSAFASQNFQANDWRSFVEFDICHSLPVVAQPASGTGNITAFHPASLAASYRELLYQQMNIEHLIKHHDPKTITHDRIIGCVVATSYPPEPEGGWQIPTDKASSIPIHCCAVVHKIAQGAIEMLNEHLSGQRKWSVSIEVMGRSVQEMGIYRPSTKELFPLMEAPDMIFEALSRKDDGRLCLGKIRTGEQLALVYGGEGHPLIFQGVGFTGSPASLEAEITAVQLSTGEGKRPTSNVQRPTFNEEQIIRTPEGVMALRASGATPVLASVAAARKYPGSTIVTLTDQGKAQLPGMPWSIEATHEDPVATIRLKRGVHILKKMSELAA
jgi:hypothetical protein